MLQLKMMESFCFKTFILQPSIHSRCPNSQWSQNSLWTLILGIHWMNISRWHFFYIKIVSSFLIRYLQIIQYHQYLDMKSVQKLNHSTFWKCSGNIHIQMVNYYYSDNICLNCKCLNTWDLLGKRGKPYIATFWQTTIHCKKKK